MATLILTLVLLLSDGVVVARAALPIDADCGATAVATAAENQALLLRWECVEERGA